MSKTTITVNTFISSRVVTKNINQLACNVSKVTKVPLTWWYLDPFRWSERRRELLQRLDQLNDMIHSCFHAQLTCSSKSAICARRQNFIRIFKPLLPLQRKLSCKKLPRSLQNAHWTALDDGHIEWVSFRYQTADQHSGPLPRSAGPHSVKVHSGAGQRQIFIHNHNDVFFTFYPKMLHILIPSNLALPLTINCFLEYGAKAPDK